MNDKASFQRVAGITALLSGPLAWLSLVVGLIGVEYDFEVFSDVNSLIAIGAEAAGLIRWSLLLNLFGAYLLLVPLLIFLWYEVRGERPLFADFYSLSGLIFLLLGAVGAAISASVWPKLINEYAQASAGQQEVLATIFRTVAGVTEEGIQSAIQNIPGAIWFLGIGSLLRDKRRALGTFALVLGLFMLLNGIGAVLQSETLSLVGLTGNLLLVPLWSIWFGIDLLRNR